MCIYIYIHVYTQHIQHDKTLINGIKYHIDRLEGFLNHQPYFLCWGWWLLLLSACSGCLKQ